MSKEQNWLGLLQTDGITLSVPELLRYRQLTHLINLQPGKPHRAAMSGTYLSKHKGRGMEFDEARHYQPGDDIRAIDWRVTARTGKTHTKVYREERERPVFILCDLTGSMQFGTQLLLKSVQAAHVTSLIAWSAAQRGDKVGALLFSDTEHRECKPLSRQRAVLTICHELIRLQAHATRGNDQASAPASFLDACARARRLARPGSLVYVISDFTHMNDTARQHITHLARHSEVKALSITDPIEHALPQVSGTRQVSVTDGFIRQSWVLGDKQQQTQYRQQREQQIGNIEHQLQLAGVRLQHLSAAMPIDEQLKLQGNRTK
ncbi:DUF58 domain-containing protein [Salinimonas sediminis]|uniref:DUF58 domain-containing protein n=1 Tax=Salinimonas sediminis TaxID=2303538 RepID=A0A346NK49_9ALTE|nr:DUF58 domain-containing protein [Salinimonas sediminis]AXR05906.1 DUF58 domain-containing protein [Salinimonas sediminis]